MNRWILGCIAGAGALLSLAAGAHTTVESTEPANGTVLDSSPARIEVRFKHAVQVTSIVAVGADKAERKLSFEPAVSTQVVTITSPALGPGRNELRWKALSNDGHVISGTLSYTVKPAGTSP